MPEKSPKSASPYTSNYVQSQYPVQPRNPSLSLLLPRSLSPTLSLSLSLSRSQDQFKDQDRGDDRGQYADKDGDRDRDSARSYRSEYSSDNDHDPDLYFETGPHRNGYSDGTLQLNTSPFVMIYDMI